MLTLKWTVPVLVAIGLAAAGQPSLSAAQTAEAKSPSLGVQPLKARVAPDATPARDLETYSEDIRLTNQCIDRGGSKAECLCVVQVLKYELPIGDYRRASRSWSVPARYSKVSASPASAPDGLRRLADAPDFAQRCDAARRYFRPAR